MSYVSKVLVRVLPLALLVFGVMIFTHGDAHAANAGVPITPAPIPSNTLPESSDFGQGNSVWMTVARADGVNFLLDAPTSTVRIYSPVPTVTVSIANGGMCPGSGPDEGPSDNAGTYYTTFSFRRLKDNHLAYDFKSAPYQDGGSAGPDLLSNAMGCGAPTPVTLNNPFNVDPSATDYAQNGKYAFEITASWHGGGAGWNQFKMSVGLGEGRLSYYAGSGDRFALKAANSACSPYVYPGCTGDFKMGFAPNCLLDDGASANVTINWFDADAGQANQGGENPVVTHIYEYTADGSALSGTPVPITNIQNLTSGGSGGNSPGNGILNITTGNSERGSATIRIRGHHKYAWIWNGIHTANGIQFQLPTDSYNTLINFNTQCSGGPQPNTASCTIVAGTAPSGNVTFGRGAFNFTVKATNTSGPPGGTNWDTNYSLERDRQDNGTPYGVPSQYTLRDNINPGGSQNFANTIGPITAGNGYAIGDVIDFTYVVHQTPGVGDIATTPNCHIHFTVVPPRAGCDPLTGCGTLVANCNSIQVTGVNVPATTSVGGLHKIRRVPVAVVLTPSDGSPAITYTFEDFGPGRNGATNGGTSGAKNTFAIPGVVPHLSYTVQLYMQGVGAGATSTTYPDDGSWYATVPPGPNWYAVTPEDDVQTVSDCLEAQCNVSQGPIDSEPGAKVDISYQVTFINRTQVRWSLDPGANQYYFVATASGGYSIISPNPIPVAATMTPTGNPDLPGITPVNVLYSIRTDYTGTTGIAFTYQGGDISSFVNPPCVPITDTPATRPFVRVSQGDLATGGGFGNSVDQSCALNDPGYIGPPTPGYDIYGGGLRAFGSSISATNKGSTADFGVLALGLNVGSTTGPIGLSSNNGEIFSTPSGGNVGGLLNASAMSVWHCTVDFYDKTQKDDPPPTNIGAGPVNVDTLAGATAQYIASGDVTLTSSDCTVAGGDIPAGRQVTLYVNGNVTIDKNICYATSYDPTTSTNVPYFTVVAKGDIILNPEVRRIDGLYIAQPKDSTQPATGAFKTCPDGGFCPFPLSVNGAVIAQHVYLRRESGTMGPLIGDPNGIGTNPAETFNYTPAMIVGQPNFNPQYNDIQALFSLPPVF